MILYIKNTSELEIGEKIPAHKETLRLIMIRGE